MTISVSINCHVQAADWTPATCVRHPPSLVVARVDLFLLLLRARVCVFYFKFFLLFLETRKESPNNELIRRTDDREDWKAMIADDLAHHDDDDDDVSGFFLPPFHKQT